MKRKINYAVVGLGHIAQTAMLPAFRHARTNSRLAALVSSDPIKLKELGKRYGVDRLYSYDEFQECLAEGIDAVYIATPNTLHQRFTEEAAAAGVHVLCEKPLASTEDACATMMRAARDNRVKLMTAYRLHFDPANLEAIRVASSHQLGDLRIFNSVFTMQVKDPRNIRLRADMGGGPLYDIGIYCLNAARYLFRSEPIEVYAASANSGARRFSEVDESTSVLLKFPDERLANFTVSFGSADSSDFDLIGTRGRLRLENAYEYAEARKLIVKKDDLTRTKNFPKLDQFAPELVYFSDCILKDRDPEPSGFEGLADVRVIEAMLESVRSGEPVQLDRMKKDKRPTLKQKIVRPAIARPPRAVHAAQPH